MSLISALSITITHQRVENSSHKVVLTMLLRPENLVKDSRRPWHMWYALGRPCSSSHVRENPKRDPVLGLHGIVGPNSLGQPALSQPDVSDFACQSKVNSEVPYDGLITLP